MTRKFETRNFVNQSRSLTRCPAIFTFDNSKRNFNNIFHKENNEITKNTRYFTSNRYVKTIRSSTVLSLSLSKKKIIKFEKKYYKSQLSPLNPIILKVHLSTLDSQLSSPVQSWKIIKERRSIERRAEWWRGVEACRIVGPCLARVDPSAGTPNSNSDLYLRMMSPSPRDQSKRICGRRLRGPRSRSGIRCIWRAARSPGMRWIDLSVAFLAPLSAHQLISRLIRESLMERLAINANLQRGV